MSKYNKEYRKLYHEMEKNKDNLTIACIPCNCAKGKKPEKEFRLWLKKSLVG